MPDNFGTNKERTKGIGIGSVARQALSMKRKRLYRGKGTGAK